MFVRTKNSGKYQYLQLVKNQRVDGRVRQQVLGAPAPFQEVYGPKRHS